ncbi:MAG: amidohydrolase [Veillonellaceae bacterium]|nr:amidohydrolase [Veillonellaceae bacterium]
MLAICGGKVYSMNGPMLEQGCVLVDGGKIVAVGAGLDIPADCERFDATGKVVTPGLVDAHTHLGVYAEPTEWSAEDGNETSGPVTPAMDALDAINPADIAFDDALAGGVTTVMIAPGSANAVGGQCVVLKTPRRSTVEDMLYKRHAGLKIAFGENPRRVYGDQQKAPVTRMATAYLVRETLQKARNYLKKKGSKDFTPDFGMDAVLRVLRREMPLRAHAHRADDIMTALRIAREFDVEIVLDHCTEGHLIAPELARRQARAAVGPQLITRAKMELKDKSYRTPAVLAEHGVQFALISDHPVVPNMFLSVYAGLAVRFGLAPLLALRAVTSDPAEILGIGDRVGKLAAGYDADIVVWSGEPLEMASRPEKIWVGGSVAELTADNGGTGK